MNKIDEIVSRLRVFGEKNFSSMSKFAEALEMKPQSLNTYLNGKQIPGGKIQSKLRELGCDIEWLMTGKKIGEIDITYTVPLMNVPVYSHVNAGEKKWVVSDDIVEFIAIPKSTDNTLFGLIVKGDSMHDEINDGDTIILSAKKEIKSGDLCVVEWMDGDRHLRRVTFDKNSIILTSKNEQLYPPIITHRSKIRMMYRVMKHIKTY